VRKVLRLASERLLNLLKSAVLREINLSIRYMWQYITVKNVGGVTVPNMLRGLATAEMKHVEAIARRLNHLGISPPTNLDAIDIDQDLSLQEMLKIDLEEEEEKLILFKVITHVADDEGDIATMRLFEEMLFEEEKHRESLLRLVEEVKKHDHSMIRCGIFKKENV